jgi:dienelactone hydrolase
VRRFTTRGRRCHADAVVAVARVLAGVVVVVAAGCGFDEPTPRLDASAEEVATPVDLSGRGPYPVGLLERTLGDRQLVVFYPADPVSSDGSPPVEGYSTRELLPDDLQRFVPVEMTFDVELQAFDMPLVSAEGPFPLVLYSHGEGGFSRVASRQLEHLASWGFIVAAPDHIERDHAAVATGSVELGGDLDVRDLLSTLDLLRRENTRAGSVLLGGIDLERIGALGHGVGGRAVERLAVGVEEIDTVIVQAPAGVPTDSEQVPTELRERPSLVIGAELDSVVPLAWVRDHHATLSTASQLVVLGDAGHQSFTDLCAPVRERGGLLQYTDVLPVPAGVLAVGEDGCVGDRLDPHDATRALNHLSVAHLRWVFELDTDRASLAPDFLAERFPHALG